MGASILTTAPSLWVPTGTPKKPASLTPLTPVQTNPTSKDEEGDNSDDDDDVAHVSRAEMMEAAAKLEIGALTAGGCGPELSDLCRKFRIELGRLTILEMRQTTLDSFFVHDTHAVVGLAVSRLWLDVT